MKKLLLFLLFLVCLPQLRAQSWVYHPFPTDSAIWTNTNGWWDVHPTSPPSATLIMLAPTRYCMTAADTIIGTDTYSKITYCGGAYRGALRDDGVGKIYFIPVDSVNELLIYNFNVLAGNVVTVYETMGNSPTFSSHTYTVGLVDSILIGTSYRKRIYVDGEHWIEGIGCTNGLFTEAWPNVSNWYVNLDCMSSKDTTLYPVYGLAPCSLYSGINEKDESADIILYPNPSSSLLQISSTKFLSRIEITDVLGKIIYQSEIKSRSIEIDLSDKLLGIYFVRLSDSKGKSVVKKIVKE